MYITIRLIYTQIISPIYHVFIMWQPAIFIKHSYKLVLLGRQETPQHHKAVTSIWCKEIEISTMRNSISRGVISIQIAAKPSKRIIIQSYASTTQYDNEEIEEFYENLEKVIKEMTSNDWLIIQGDWNAKISTDAYERWSGTVGRCGVGEMNDHDTHLLGVFPVSQINTPSSINCPYTLHGIPQMVKSTIK